MNNIFKKGIVIGIMILLTTIFSGCSKEDTLIGTGRVRYIDLEGGFYGIVSDNGENYDPLNLPDEFKQDYLNISFKAKILTNQSSYHMWGKIVYIIEIEKINITGKLTNYTDCKKSKEDSPPSDKDCIKYDYDGNKILLLKHVNAGFNCCPAITANINVTGNVITIEEIEISGYCDCLCLYDLNYEISNLDSGEYLITVNEPYIHEDEEILQFTVNLSSSNSGSYCVDRYHYPWG
jgi:hypothetical protein